MTLVWHGMKLQEPCSAVVSKRRDPTGLNSKATQPGLQGVTSEPLCLLIQIICELPLWEFLPMLPVINSVTECYLAVDAKQIRRNTTQMWDLHASHTPQMSYVAVSGIQSHWRM